MSNPFTKAPPSARRSILAASVVTASLALACGSPTARAADLAVKAPEAPTYQWSGCYAGLNLGGGTSGTNFTSTVGPGTHLLGADPAVVGSERRRRSKCRRLACRWTGRLQLAERHACVGSGRRFRLLPQQSQLQQQHQHAERRRHAVHHLAIADHRLPGDRSAAHRHRRRIATSPTSPAASPSPG